MSEGGEMADLSTYYAQLEQVERLVASDPDNSTYQKLRSDILLLIDITKRAINDGMPTVQSSDDLNEMSSSFLCIGDVVEVKGEDRVYAGVITKVNNDDGNYDVKYYEFDAIATLPFIKVTKLLPNPNILSAQVVVGYKCLCKYSQDQQYYEAAITEITANGVKVTYAAYGSSEEVPIQYLKPINSSTGANGSGGGENTGQSKLITIPEHLLIKPTDTEEEKERKRKKIKAIKSKNKTIEINNMFAKSQQSWQSFKDKGAKKSLAGIAKTSIFTRTDKDDKKQVTEYERKRSHFHTSKGSN